MKILKLFSLFAFVLASFNLSAQSEETVFSRSNLKLSGAWGSAAFNFTSFSDEDWTLVRGGYGGIEFNRDVFIGWGGYETRDRVKLEDGSQPFSLKYNGPVLAIAPNSVKAFHPRFTFLAGGGRVWTNNESDADKVFVFQPSAGIEMNIFQWFRLGFDAGYRFVGESGDLGFSSGDLSAPFAQVELRFGLSWGD